MKENRTKGSVYTLKGDAQSTHKLNTVCTSHKGSGRTREEQECVKRCPQEQGLN